MSNEGVLKSVAASALATMLFFSLGVIPALGQPLQSSIQISGHYVDPGSGLEITFPSGWAGFEQINSNSKQISVSASGFPESTLVPATAIQLVISDIDQGTIVLPFTPSQAHLAGCIVNSAGFERINGMIAYELVMECSRDTYEKYAKENGTYDGRNAELFPKYTKSKLLALSTETKKIFVHYQVDSPEKYNRHFPEFVASVATLKIPGTTDVRDLIWKNHGLVEREAGLDLGHSIAATTVIEGYGARIYSLDYDGVNALILADIRGPSDSGVVLIPVGQMLKGPYNVTIDNAASRDHLIVTDNATGFPIDLVMIKRDGSYKASVTGTPVLIQVCGTMKVAPASAGPIALVLTPQCVSVNAGDRAELSVEVTANQIGRQDAYYLFFEATGMPGGASIGYESTNAYVNYADPTTSLPIRINTNLSTQPGTYNVTVMAGVVGKPSAMDTRQIVLHVLPASCPPTCADLGVSDVSFAPSDPSPGDTVTISYTETNNGNAAAPAHIVGYSVDGKTGYFQDRAPSLSPGASQQRSFPQTWAYPGGLHEVIVNVDTMEYVKESNEDNNLLTVKFGKPSSTDQEGSADSGSGDSSSVPSEPAQTQETIIDVPEEVNVSRPLISEQRQVITDTEYLNQKARSYATLADAWEKPIYEMVLDPSLDYFFQAVTIEGLSSIISASLPIEYQILYDMANSVIDAYDQFRETRETSWWVFATGSDAEEEHGHALTKDYECYGGIGICAEADRDVPIRFVLAAQRDLVLDELHHRGEYLDTLDWFNNVFSEGKDDGKALDDLRKQKANIPELQELVEWMDRHEEGATTEDYKALAGLTKEYLRADIAYLSSVP